MASPALAETHLADQYHINSAYLLAAAEPKSAPAIAATEPDQATPPAPALRIISVQSGDYLEKIATNNDTTSLRLFYANADIVHPNKIYPDQKLRIPAADEQLTPRDLPVEPPVTTKPTAPRQTVQTPSVTVPAASAATGSVWDRLAVCEAGGNWAINTGNGFYGGLQFTLSSWRAVGGSGYPHHASRDEQILRGQMLQSQQGWGAWPACSAKLGLR